MSEFYKPRRAYEYDWENKVMVGRFFFIIGGEMADGTKCWYKCDQEGNIENYDRWYSMTRMAGKMIALLEAEN